MLQDIYKELTKKIAQTIYDEVKKLPGKYAEVKKILKQSGLPQAVLQRFDEEFEFAISNKLGGDGSASWRDGKSETRFDFVLTSTIIDSIRKGAKWVESAGRTEEGRQLIQACGGPPEFRRVVDKAVPQLVANAIEAQRGQFCKTGTDSGWRIPHAGRHQEGRSPREGRLCSARPVFHSARKEEGYR